MTARRRREPQKLAGLNFSAIRSAHLGAGEEKGKEKNKPAVRRGSEGEGAPKNKKKKRKKTKKQPPTRPDTMQGEKKPEGKRERGTRGVIATRGAVSRPSKHGLGTV